jgi:uncharacterized membrane protein
MIPKILKFLLKLRDKAQSAKKNGLIGLIICFMVECINNPKGAINTFMIHFIDVIVDQFPSTPAQYTLSGLLSSYQATSPVISVGILSELFTMVIPIFSLYLLVKIYKFLPFT